MSWHHSILSTLFSSACIPLWKVYFCVLFSRVNLVLIRFQLHSSGYLMRQFNGRVNFDLPSYTINLGLDVDPACPNFLPILFTPLRNATRHDVPFIQLPNLSNKEAERSKTKTVEPRSWSTSTATVMMTTAMTQAEARGRSYYCLGRPYGYCSVVE